MRSASRIASSKSWVMKTMVLLQRRLQAQELVLHLAPDQRVERRERLVQEPDLRPHRQRARDPHPLLLPARQLPRQVALRPLRPDELDHLARPRLALARARRPAPPAERRRCAARSGAAAGRSSGTPCPCGAGAARSARGPAPASGRAPRSGPRPAVGSTRRDRQRTSVDLPEPDRPMMTKISPGGTARLASITAGDQPRRRDLLRLAAPGCRRGTPPRRDRTASRRGCRRSWASAAVMPGCPRVANG